MIAILGGGITGLNLAFTFEKKGFHDFVIIDNPKKNFSSSVAAGLFNPITFRKISLGWFAEEVTPFAHQFYPEIEKICGINFFQSLPLLKIFSGLESQNDWELAFDKKELKPYLNQGIKHLNESIYSNSFGCGEVNFAGYLEVEKFLTAARKHFSIKNKLLFDEVRMSEIEKKEESFQVKTSNKTWEFSKIISCLGAYETENPFFKYLPWAPVKGEGITIYAPSLDENLIISKKCFVLPLGSHLFKVGSTYDWSSLSTEKTMAAKKEMQSQLEEIIKCDYEITDQWVGIRPATRDRRPFVGEHPEVNGMFVLGGMGSKAVLLCPYFANEIAELVLNKKAISKEADIKRYEKYLKAL